MRVTFVQSGGFAGVTRHCVLDTSTMSADDARTLEGLVAKVDAHQSREVRSRSARDEEEYAITIDTGAAPVTLVHDQSTVPAEAKALVGYLKKRAKPGLPK
jgi:hypothetical protein